MPAPVITISDPADPRVAPYLNLRDRDLQRLALAPGADPHGLFICEAELTVRQLIGSRFNPVSMLVTERKAQALGDLLEVWPSDAPVYIADPPVMNAIAGFDIHRGVLAAVRRGPATLLNDLLATRRVLVVGEALSNHDNVGGLFRSVAGIAGSEHAGIVLDPRACDPLYRKSVRVSIGQALRLGYAVAEDWPGDLLRLCQAGFTIVALTPGPGSVDLRTIAPPERLALLVGAEGPGLSEEAMRHADIRARIDMQPGVDSLNVVVATAIALHALLPR